MNDLGLTENQRKKQLKILESSIEMFENTKKETEREMRNKLDENGRKRFTKEDIDEQIAVIQKAENDQYAKYELFGGNVEELKAKKGKKKERQETKDLSMDLFSKLEMSDSTVDINNIEVEPEKKQENIIKEVEFNPVKIEDEKDNEIITKETINNSYNESNTITDDDIDTYLPSNSSFYNGETFDVIPLPSNGECYKSKTKKVAVSYLTANDENMIVSPNLYRDKLILDYLLKKKIKDCPIDPMDMLDGDREAVILFLRASGYGNEYPVTAKDKVTGKDFETVIDLSKLKYKEFKLKSDENGYFDFKLPVTKKNIKFRFLTHRDKLKIKKFEEIETKKMMKGRLSLMVSDMDSYVEGDESIKEADKVKIRQAIREIDKWRDGIDDNDTVLYNHVLTNQLEMSIMSIDGNTDREYIHGFINSMPVKDSSELRKYMIENEPGINYSVDVEKPESLGGGSMKVFLQFDEYLFLNIA